MNCEGRWKKFLVVILVDVLLLLRIFNLGNFCFGSVWQRKQELFISYKIFICNGLIH